MDRRAFLAGFVATASGLLVPETRRVYSFMPRDVPWPYGSWRLLDITGRFSSSVCNEIVATSGSGGRVILPGDVVTPGERIQLRVRAGGIVLAVAAA